MRNIQTRILALLLAALMLLGLTACGEEIAGLTEEVFSEPGIAVTAVLEETLDEPETSEAAETPDEPETPEAPEADTGTRDSAVTEGTYYYDLEHVVLYLDRYGVLPENYITKDEARELGWEGGSVENYLDGAAIGGDRFGNREGLLPDAAGRSYTECDIDTDGQTSRGAKRLVFSNDGLYFYTEDHYETFDELYVTETQEVAWK